MGADAPIPPLRCLPPPPRGAPAAASITGFPGPALAPPCRTEALRRGGLIVSENHQPDQDHFQSQIDLRKKFFNRPLTPRSHFFNRDPIDRPERSRRRRKKGVKYALSESSTYPAIKRVLYTIFSRLIHERQGGPGKISGGTGITPRPASASQSNSRPDPQRTGTPSPRLP